MANGSNVNKFAYAFNKIRPPESGSPEDMAAYNTKINATFEAIYGTIHGYLGMRNLSTAVQKAINSKVDSEDLLGYSTIEQTAESIKLEVGRIDESIANITVMADEISASVVDLEENVSLVQQRADEISSSVADKASVSYVNQTASSLTSYINNTTSGLLNYSQMTQYVNSFVFTLKDESIISNFEVKISNFAPDGRPFRGGLGFFQQGTNLGFIGISGTSTMYVSGGYGATMYSQSETTIMSGTSDPQSYVSCVGYAGDGRVYASKALTISSDVRLKKDISDVDPQIMKLIDLLSVRQYHWRSGGNRLSFGVIAQELESLMHELGINPSDVELIDLGDEERKMSICYEQFIPLLIGAHQRQQEINKAQQKEIDDLKTRLTRLEGMIAK